MACCRTGPLERPIYTASTSPIRSGIFSYKVDVVLIHVYRTIITSTTFSSGVGTCAGHRCTRVSVGDRTFAVDAPYFNVRLEPGAGETPTITQKRRANQPTPALPWDRIWMVRN